MAGTSEVRYEVHVNDAGRWTVFTDAPTKGRAIQEAQTLLGSGKFDAAKVTEERGQRKEILVWREEVQRVVKGETITPIDDAPLCRTLDDFYAFEARIALGRLLRQYLDNRTLTPIELIHDYALIREFTRKEDMHLQALQTMSALLGRKGKRKPAEVMTFLEEIVAKMSRRAESLGDIEALTAALDGGVGKLVEAAAAARPPAERAFAVRAALARRLRRWRDWEGKLIAMLDLADKDAGEESLALIDECVAEILDGSEAVQEVLGYRRNLAAAIEIIVRIAAGGYRLGEEGANTPLERLSALMGAKPMARTRATLMERVIRSLSGIAPLTKGDRREEQDAFRELIRQLIGTTMFVNSGPLCAAATLRAKSVLKEEFDDESYEKAIDDMIFLLPTFASKLGYLLDLLATDFGRRCQDHIIACLANLLASVTSMAQIVDKGASDEATVRAAAGIRDRLLATELPQEWRQRFAKRIYDLLITHTNGGRAPASIAKAARAMAAEEPAPAKPAATPAGDDTLKRRQFEAGEIVFREGEPGDSAYLIVSGKVDIIKRAGDRDIVIAQTGPGSIIGEMALIDSAPRMATARAATDTALTVIPREEIVARLDRLEKSDPIMRRLMGMFVQRMRDFRFISADS